ncbi:MAG: hypothetical protein KGO94_05110 [Alphaproteobacteria bacterium]|nr:hypothetical protein [Alphaproteobacteria bacterium]
MKFLLTFAALFSSASLALAGVAAPTPGPLLGAVAGPWGLAVGVLSYGAYRFYRSRQ